MNILAFDVSGNFQEGKGTSGVAEIINDVLTHVEEIKATDFETFHEYWQEHVDCIDSFIEINPMDTTVVVEGFRLYGDKAKEQTHSIFETPQLIGLLRWHCAMKGIPFRLQYAVEVKQRWHEDVLVKTEVLEHKNKHYFFNKKMTNQHMRDAMKHALHYQRYGVKKPITVPW